MSQLQIARPDTASHWYLVKEDGVEAFHSVPYAGKRGKNGERRKTTLRDARKAGAFPSVTNILGILHKDFLEAYKINQAILAALTLPKMDGELVHEFAKRVVQDSKEHAASAARLGERIHEIGADLIQGKTLAKTEEIIEGRILDELITPLADLISEITPSEHHTDSKFSEFYVSHPLGFAGTCDGLLFLDEGSELVREKLAKAGYESLLSDSGPKTPIIAVVDIKSRGADTKTPLVYETDILQLAAYLHSIPHTPGLGLKFNTHTHPVANILINTHQDAGTDGRWEADIVIHDKEDVDKAWDAFKHAHALWCWVKKYNPSQNQQPTSTK